MYDAGGDFDMSRNFSLDLLHWKFGLISFHCGGFVLQNKFFEIYVYSLMNAESYYFFPFLLFKSTDTHTINSFYRSFLRYHQQITAQMKSDVHWKAEHRCRHEMKQKKQ